MPLPSTGALRGSNLRREFTSSNSGAFSFSSLFNGNLLSISGIVSSGNPLAISTLKGKTNINISALSQSSVTENTIVVSYTVVNTTRLRIQVIPEDGITASYTIGDITVTNSPALVANTPAFVTTTATFTIGNNSGTNNPSLSNGTIYTLNLIAFDNAITPNQTNVFTPKKFFTLSSFSVSSRTKNSLVYNVTLPPLNSNITYSATAGSNAGVLSSNQFTFSSLLINTLYTLTLTMTLPSTFIQTSLTNTKSDRTLAVVNSASGTSSNSSTASITWSASSGATVSIVSNPVTTTQTASSSPYTFTGLNPSVAYTFTLSAINNDGNINNSVSDQITTSSITTLAKVNSASAGTITSNSVQIIWSATAGATVSITSNPSSTTTTQTASSSPYTFTGLTANTSYTFTLSAVTTSTNTTASDQQTITTTTLAVVNSAIASNGVDGSSATITWTASAGATVSITSNPTTTTQTASVSPYTFTGLTIGQAYTFTVSAVNSSSVINNNVSERITTNSVTTIVTDAFAYDNLSTTAKNNLNAVFATRRVLSSYTGPMFRLRGSNALAASVTQDFYADIFANLGTSINATGTSLLEWMRTNSHTTVFVNTWYDQSGNGKNATQSTAGSQPIYDANYKYVDFKYSRFMQMQGGVIPYQNYYTVCTRHNNITSNNGTILAGGLETTGNGFGFRRDTNSYINYWWTYTENDGTYASGNVVTIRYGGNTGYLTTDDANNLTGSANSPFIKIYFYINSKFTNNNGSTVNTRLTGNWSAVAGSFDFIGKRAVSNTEYLDGELYFLSIFKMALSDSDRSIAESIDYYKQGSTTLYTSGLRYMIYSSTAYTNNPAFSYLTSSSPNSAVNYSGISTNFLNLSTMTNSVINITNTSTNLFGNYNIEWYGVFYPLVTGIYTFIINSDDDSYVFIGSSAERAYTNSADIYTTIDTGADNISSHGSVALTAKTFYPIRLIWGEGTNTEYFIMSIIPPYNNIQKITATPTATSSSFYLNDNNYNASKAFDGNVATLWHGNIASYTTTSTINGASITNIWGGGTTATTSGIADGEWIQAQYATAFRVIAVRITPRTDIANGYTYAPREFYLVGSNNGTSWTNLAFIKYIRWTNNDPQMFYLYTNNLTYTYYRIIIRVTAGFTYTAIGEIEFYGDDTTGQTNNLSGYIFTNSVPLSNLRIFLDANRFNSNLLWEDQSGNGVNWTLTNNSLNQPITATATGLRYMNFNSTGSFGKALYNVNSTLTDFPSSTLTNEYATIIIISRPLSIVDNSNEWRTLLRSNTDGLHHIILQEGRNSNTNNNVGMWRGTFYPSGFNLNNVTNFNTSWNMYVWKLSTNPVSVLDYNEYPPSGLTANTTTLSGQLYGNGTYVASSSSQSSASYTSFRAFNKTTGLIWSSSGRYNSTDGTYASTNSLGGVSGENLRIQLPSSIVLTSYILTVGSDNNTRMNSMPRSWTILGSTDGTTWVSLDTRTNQTWTLKSEQRIFTITNTTAYSYYAIVVQTVPAGTSLTIIGEWKLFGSEYINTYYQFKLNTGPYYNIINSNASYTNGFCTIGSLQNVSGNAGQNWGDISQFLYYDRHLSEDEIFNVFQDYRNYYNIQPIASDLTFILNSINTVLFTWKTNASYVIVTWTGGGTSGPQYKTYSYVTTALNNHTRYTFTLTPYFTSTGALNNNNTYIQSNAYAGTGVSLSYVTGYTLLLTAWYTPVYDTVLDTWSNAGMTTSSFSVSFWIRIPSLGADWRNVFVVSQGTTSGTFNDRRRPGVWIFANKRSLLVERPSVNGTSGIETTELGTGTTFVTIVFGSSAFNVYTTDGTTVTTIGTNTLSAGDSYLNADSTYGIWSAGGNLWTTGGFSLTNLKFYNNLSLNTTDINNIYNRDLARITAL